MSKKGTVVAQDEVMEIVRMELGPFGTNAYIVVCRETGDSVVVDAPGEAELLMKQLKGTNPRCILITHAHADHTLALEELKEKLGVPVAAHDADSGSLPVRPDLLLGDGDMVDCGKLKLSVLHTPGHTPGSLCFKIGDTLLAGDTVFPGGPGKTWSPAELKQIIESISARIFTLPGETRLLPGHGHGTSVAPEKEQFAAFASRPRDPGLCGDVSWLDS